MTFSNDALERIEAIDQQLPSARSALEVGELEYERWQSYRVLHPAVKKGDYLADRRDQQGVSTATLRRRMKVAEDIPADVRDDIRGHPIAERWGELAALSKLAPADQQRAARVAAIDADHRLTRVSDLLAAVTPDGELLDTLPEPAPKPPTKRAQIEDLLIAAVAGQITYEDFFSDVLCLFDDHATVELGSVKNSRFGGGCGPAPAADVRWVKQQLSRAFPKAKRTNTEEASQLWHEAKRKRRVIMDALNWLESNRQRYGRLNRPGISIAQAVTKRIWEERREAEQVAEGSGSG